MLNLKGKKAKGLSMQKIHAKVFYLPNYDKSWGPMTYAHDTDTGFDIRACNTEDIVLAPNERKVIPAGFKIMPQTGFALQIRARSGNASKFGLGLVNGVGTIDNGYLGEIGIIVINLGSENITIARGTKIAQGVVEPVLQFEFEEVLDEKDLGSTQRGEGGFGSTGTK